MAQPSLLEPGFRQTASGAQGRNPAASSGRAAGAAPALRGWEPLTASSSGSTISSGILLAGGRCCCGGDGPCSASPQDPAPHQLTPAAEALINESLPRFGLLCWTRGHPSPPPPCPRFQSAPARLQDVPQDPSRSGFCPLSLGKGKAQTLRPPRGDARSPRARQAQPSVRLHSNLTTGTG